MFSSKLTVLITIFSLSLVTACGDIVIEDHDDAPDDSNNTNNTTPEGNNKKQEVKPTATCPAKDTQWIPRPMSKDANSKQFAYVFHYKKPKPGKPTIIYLPGGPGQTSISASPENPYPADFGVINTDPRGVGCNKVLNIDDPKGFWTTDLLAQDVVDMIKHLKLDNYIVHGLSYGTLLGTVVAHKIEQQNITPPRAVILEGVLGKSFESYNKVLDGYNDTWQFLAQYVDDVIFDYFAEPEPLGITEQQWGSILSTLMSIGGSPTQEHPLVSSLNAIAYAEDPYAVAAQLKAQLYQDEDHTQIIPLYTHIACREVAQIKTLKMIFSQGVFQAPEGDNLCGQLALANPFDVKDYQYKTTTYYFLGELDPNTPLAQGEYHYQNLKQAKRTKVVVPSAGHNPLSHTMSGQSCLTSVFDGISKGESIDQALGTCDFQVVVESQF